jgi:hypothetical protein
MLSSALGTVLLAISGRKRHRAVLCWAFTPSFNFWPAQAENVDRPELLRAQNFPLGETIRSLISN